MDEARRQLILSDIAQSIKRRGWDEVSPETADQVFQSELEMKRFTYKHECEVTAPSGKGVIFTRKSVE